MSHPDQNDPYQQPQQDQQQQPYSYPQHPAGGQQYPVYPGGAGQPYAGDPGEVPAGMPGKTTAARIMMFVAGGLQGLLSLLMLIAVVAVKDEMDEAMEDQGYDFGAGAIGAIAVVYLLHAVMGIVLASMFGKGGGGVRVTSIVWASITIAVGLSAFPLGVLWIVLGIVCIVMLANADSGRWFNRPKA